jgi:hypothetical protein
MSLFVDANFFHRPILDYYSSYSVLILSLTTSSVHSMTNTLIPDQAQSLRC